MKVKIEEKPVTKDVKEKPSPKDVEEKSSSKVIEAKPVTKVAEEKSATKVVEEKSVTTDLKVKPITKVVEEKPDKKPLQKQSEPEIKILREKPAKEVKENVANEKSEIKVKIPKETPDTQVKISQEKPETEVKKSSQSRVEIVEEKTTTKEVKHQQERPETTTEIEDKVVQQKPEIKAKSEDKIVQPKPETGIKVETKVKIKEKTPESKFEIVGEMKQTKTVSEKTDKIESFGLKAETKVIQEKSNTGKEDKSRKKAIKEEIKQMTFESKSEKVEPVAVREERKDKRHKKPTKNDDVVKEEEDEQEEDDKKKDKSGKTKRKRKIQPVQEPSTSYMQFQEKIEQDEMYTQGRIDFRQPQVIQLESDKSESKQDKDGDKQEKVSDTSAVKKKKEKVKYIEPHFKPEQKATQSLLEQASTAQTTMNFVDVVKEKQIITRWQNTIQKLQHHTQLVERGRRQSLLPTDSASLVPPTSQQMTSHLLQWREAINDCPQTSLVLDEQWVTIVETVLQWLESTQYYVYLIEQNVDLEWRVDQFKMVAEKLDTLAHQIQILKCDAKLDLCSEQTQRYFLQIANHMNGQIQTLQAETSRNSNEIKHVQNEWNVYLEQVAEYRRNLAEIQLKFQEICHLQTTPSESIAHLEQLENRIEECQQNFNRLQINGDDLLSKHPGLGINPLLTTAKVDISKLELQLRRYKDGLMQEEGFQEQYKKLLDDYQQILDAAQLRLNVDLRASSVDSLRENAIRQKELFALANQYHSLLDSLSLMTDPVTRERCQPFHTQLQERARDILARGTLHGQRLDHLIAGWTRLEAQVSAVEQVLHLVGEKLSDPSLISITPQALDSNMAIYQNLDFDLLGACGEIEGISLSEGQLLCLIEGTPLATRLEELRALWTVLHDRVSGEVRKTSHMQEGWQECEKIKDELECWLNFAGHEIKRIETHFKQVVAGKCSPDVKNLLHFWELKNGLIRQQMLFDKLRFKLKQLNLIPVLDAKYLKTLEGRLENDIRHVKNLFEHLNDFAADVNVVQLIQEFIRLQRQLPSADQLNRYRDVKAAVDKYKDMEGAAEQVYSHLKTSDENESLQMEFHKNSIRVKASAARVDCLCVRLSEFDESVQRAENDLDDMEDKLKKIDKAQKSNKKTAELALKKNKDLMNEINGKKNILQRVSLLTKKMQDYQDCNKTLMKNINQQTDTLEKRWHTLESGIKQLDTKLASRIDGWNHFHIARDAFLKKLLDLDYVIAQNTVPALEIEAFSYQIQELQVLSDDMKKNDAAVMDLVSAANKIKSESSRALAETINSSINEFKRRWLEKEELVAGTAGRMQPAFNVWQQYRQEYENLNKELETQEVQFQELLSNLVTLNHDEKMKHIEICKQLLQQVQATGHRCNRLQELSSKLQSEQDISLAVKAHTPGEVDFFMQKQVFLATEISHHCDLVGEEIKEVDTYVTVLTTIDTFLDKVQKLLAEQSAWSTDPHLLQQKVTVVKNLLLEFSDLEPCMTTLRETHGRIRLDEEKQEQVASVLHSWSQLCVDLLQRHQWLQTQLVVSTDCSERLLKCQFSVEETKNVLVTSSTGFADVIQQQRKVDLYQLFLENQQNLLVTQSHLLLEGVPANEAKHIEQQIAIVKENTQQTIDAVNVCSLDLSSHVQLWKTYQQQYDKVLQWLKMIEREKLQLRLKHTPIKKVGKILKRLEILLDNMKDGEELMDELQIAVSALVEKSDKVTGTNLKTEVGRVLQRLENCRAGLLTWYRFLEHLRAMWSSVENVVSDLHLQLHNARNLLAVNKPTSRKDLIRRRSDCLEFLNRVNEMTTSFEALNEHEEELIESIAPTDVKLLHHRVHLLRNLWIETRHQLQMDIESTTAALAQWDNFYRRRDALYAWMAEMERKLADRSEVFVEDLISKLETIYCQEMDEKMEEYTSLLTLGENLKAAEESEVEVNTLDTLMTETKNKWNNLVAMRENRLSSLRDILTLLHQLDEQLSYLQKWFKEIELKLDLPIDFKHVSMDELKLQFNALEDVQQQIDNRQNDVNSVFGLCSRLKSDANACPTEGDLIALEQTISDFEQRWERINRAVSERKAYLKETQAVWDDFLTASEVFSSWLISKEKFVHEPIPKDLTYENAKLLMLEQQQTQQEVEDELKNLDNINKKYRILIRTGRVDSEGIARKCVARINESWDEVRQSATRNLAILRPLIERRQNLEMQRAESLSWLTEINQQLSNIEHFSDDKSDERLHQLQMVHDLLTQGETKLHQVNETGRQAIEEWGATEKGTIANELEEFSTFCSDVKVRMQRLKHDLSKQKITIHKIDHQALVKQIIVTDQSSEHQHENQDRVQIDHLAAAISESADRLEKAEAALRCPTPVTFKVHKSPEGYSRQLASCRSSIELVQHLIQQDVGLTKLQCGVPLDVQGILQRWTVLEVEALEKERRLKDAYRQWCQFVKDLIAMEAWLDEADRVHENKLDHTDDLARLERAVQTHKNFLVDLDMKKASILSLNITAQQIAEKEPDALTTHEFMGRIKTVNSRWEKICENASARQMQLQSALLQCHEFEDTIRDLLDWIELTESSIRQLEPIELKAERSVLEMKLRKFQELKAEIENCQGRVASFQQAAAQFIVHTNTKGARDTKLKLDELALRLRPLNHVCDLYVDKLTRLIQSETEFDHETRVAQESEEFGPTFSLSQQFFEDFLNGADNSRVDKLGLEPLSKCSRFMGRVMRAALPIQALMLLLLGIAALIPVSEQDYSCGLANNFARSFEPMLQYTDGPPPI